MSFRMSQILILVYLPISIKWKKFNSLNSFQNFLKSANNYDDLF